MIQTRADHRTLYCLHINRALECDRAGLTTLAAAHRISAAGHTYAQLPLAQRPPYYRALYYARVARRCRRRFGAYHPATQAARTAYDLYRDAYVQSLPRDRAD